MHTLEYIVNSAAWSAVGLVIGYLLGKTRRLDKELHEREPDDDDA